MGGDAMAGHKPGSMDIETQEKTFSSFITWSVRVVIAVVVILIFLALVNG
jgi:hypothetical protein